MDLFATPNLEALKLLKRRRAHLTFNYDELIKRAHHQAFTVAKITKLDLLLDIQNSIKNALENGQGFDAWKHELVPTLKRKGWWGFVTDTDPKTGEQKKFFVGSRRLKTIYYTNIRTAFAVSNYQEAINGGAKYLRYIAKDDGKTRLSHLALHNIILPINHPFWKTHYPPNAWNCRCTAIGVSDDTLERQGLKVTKHLPKDLPSPHKDWGYHVGQTSRLKEILDERLNKKARNAIDLYALGLSGVQEKQLALMVKGETDKVKLGTSDIFGQEMDIFATQRTLTSHLEKHPEVSIKHYALLPQLLKNIVYSDYDRGNKKKMIIIARVKKSFLIILSKSNNKIRVSSIFEVDNNKINAIKERNKQFANKT